MIKLVATDLDGTLFNKKKEISEYTRNILLKLIERGIILCIVTGRYLVDIKNKIEKYGLKAYYINMNGAEINSPEAKLIDEINISNLRVDKINDIIMSYDLFSELYTNDGEYMLGIDKAQSLDELYNRFMLEYGTITKEHVSNHKRYINRKYVQNINDIEKKGIGVRKIITFSSDIDKISLLKDELLQFEDIVCTSSMPYNLEINDKSAQKGYALKKLIKELNILDDEVMVFGDGENDIQMFKLFKNTVAMENAIDELKEISKDICGHHDEDGVAKFIEQNILR